jgi:ABC-type multidrug transport system ATPase subunit
VVEWAHATGGTVVTALQAPTPEVVASFDEVLLLSDGHELFHGTPAELPKYLAQRGFACPSYCDIADFALALCVSPSFTASTYCVHAEGAKPPPAELQSREALAAEWSRARADAGTGADAGAGGSAGVVLATEADRSQFAVDTVRSSWAHTALLVSRQFKVVKRNPAVSIGRVNQFIILSAIYGSVYYKIATDSFVVKISMSIFAASAVSFASFAEIPAIFVGKRTAARQIGSNFYTPMQYVLSVALNSLPIGILSTFLFATILYWMTGFANDVGRYFFFVLSLLTHELSTAALFRSYAFAMPTEELAQAAAGITTGSLLVFGGFYIAYPIIPKYFWSIYYLSPFSWTVRSIVNSEFTSSDYMTTICTPGSLGPFVQPDPCLKIKSDVFLDAFGFFKGDAWRWGGIGYTLAFAVVFGLVFSSLAVTYFRAKEAPGSQRITEAAFLSAAAASAAAIKATATPGAAAAAKERPPSGSGAAEATTVVNPSVVAVGGATSASSVLPFQPVSLSFEGITYEVTVGKGAIKPLLRGITGVARPGTLTALMGASGAGKTTLMDVLAFRKTTGKVGGKICLNGEPATAASFSRLAGFAEQEDIHIDYSTVREAIAFSASMRLPASVGAAQREAFVDEVVRLLELEPLAGRRTGSLAQGESKRLTIAVELAANPSILFLDEPTTGLDARAAAVVMRVIRNVANTGRTVVATIHQPSAEVFFGFDRLLVLVPGGYEAYVGALGAQACELERFLGAVPGVKALPQGTNPATWMLSEMGELQQQQKRAKADDAKEAVVVASDGGSSNAGGGGVAVAYAASPLRAATSADLAALAEEKAPLPPALARASFARAFVALLDRMLRYSWRNTSANTLRLLVFLTLAIFFGLAYQKTDDSTYAGAFSKFAVALNGLLFLSIINLNTTIPVVFRNRGVFYRERSSGTYPALAYPLSNLVTEIIWTAFFALVFVAINYNLVGFRMDARAFFVSYLATFLSGLWFAILAMGFCAFFPVALLSNIAGGVTIQISILFAGVNLSRAELPEGWRFMYDSDGFAHALRVFFLPQYENDNTMISDPSPTLTMTRSAFSMLRLGVAPSDLGTEIGKLVAIIAGAAVLMIFFTVRINHQKR